MKHRSCPQMKHRSPTGYLEGFTCSTEKTAEAKGAADDTMAEWEKALDQQSRRSRGHAPRRTGQARQAPTHPGHHRLC